MNHVGTVRLETDRLDAHPLSEDHKREICAWRYEGQCAVYNLPPYEEMAAKGAGFMNPARADNYTGFSVGGRLAGYVNLMEKPGGLFVGIGVHPELVGQGIGRRILESVRQKHPGRRLYLEVRAWNERAIRCYRAAGFEIVTEPYMQTTGAGRDMFYKMEAK